jgi:hypothetical protein
MKQSKKYREALQNRSITPSENLWEQLSEQLDAHETVQKKNNKWVFLKYAASILLLVSASLFFFQPKNEIIITPLIEAPAVNEEIKNLPEINSTPTIKIVENSKIKTPSIKQSLEVTEIELKNEAVAVNETFEMTENETIINKEIEITSIVSEVTTIDNEVDALLKNAKTNQVLNRKKVISANALLTEVEEDLDKDFKDKLIDNIVNTLKKPRIVVTDRNN